METRSPLEGIFNMIGGLPRGHDKPVKHALFNAVAIFLLFLCVGAGWALYLILEPFIKPLMWALLAGSVLHPLKRSLRDTFHDWFETLEITHTPVVIGLILIPINIINNLSDFIGDNLLKYKYLLLTIAIFIPFVHITYFYTPSIINGFIWQVITVTKWLIHLALYISTVPLIFFIVIFYLSVVYITWRPENNQKFHFYSMGVWFLISFGVANKFETFALPVFMLMQVLLLAGLVFELYCIYEKRKNEGECLSIMSLIALALQGENQISETESSENDTSSNKSGEDKNNELTEERRKSTVKFADELTCKDDQMKEEAEDSLALDLFKEKTQKLKTRTSDLTNTSLLITDKGIHVIQPPRTPQINDIYKSKRTKPQSRLQRSMSQPQFNIKPKNSNFLNFGLSFYRRASIQDSTGSENHGSTFYLYSVIWACVIMLFWKNVMLLPLLPLPILYYSLKHLGLYLGIWQWAYSQGRNVLYFIYDWCSYRHDAFVPIPIMGLYKILKFVNTTIKTFIKESIDTVTSVIVIMALLIFVTCASLFFIIQIYGEGIMLVQITSNVINQTVVHNPELRQLLPPEFDETIDSLLDNAYLYGREGISKAVKSLMTEVDSSKSEKIEKQVLELWDRFYQLWMTSNSHHGPQVTQEAVMTSWDAFIADIKKSPEMFNIKGLMDFARQNIGTLMSLTDSIWSIVKGNISLALGSISTFLSLILGGGTAVMNFILNVVVFLTTLFYLLNSSGDLYKPVEILTNFSTSGSRFGHALEGAINGVFTASFKMASFYGFWTWFIHNLFGVRIVYLPSAFATILGAVPFLGTYWAGVPAVLDLWLAQDRGLAAIIFAIFQYLPTYVVDTTIYKEIKGGHPYLTGLAIAGGIFCLGVEGAIIGPILLCGLYVVIDLSSTLFKESPSEESLNIRLHKYDS